MKNLSLILNGILIIAVGILYYLHFHDCRIPEPQSATIEVIEPSKMQLPATLQNKTILYINADTLNKKYVFVQQLQKETEARQARLEASYETKAKAFQNDYTDYQQKIQAGTVTVDQAKVIEENLQKKKQEIDMMEGQLQTLMQDAQKKNLQVQKEVFSFLKEFSKTKNINYVFTYSENTPGLVFANDSLDITREVLKGLNAKYNSNKK